MKDSHENIFKVSRPF